MTFRNTLKAISLAVTIFIVLQYSLTLGANYLANDSENFLILLPWLNLTAYFLYLLVGFIAGVLSTRQHIVVGLIAGLISALSVVLVFGVGGDAFGIFSTLASGLVLGSIGGGLSLLLKKRTAIAR